jgi:hypothetical protein
MRSQALPGIGMYTSSVCRPALPSLRSDGTSPGSLSWLYESPANLRLASHDPGATGGSRCSSWRARFTDSHSSLGLVSSFLEHVIPVTLRVPDLLKAFYSFLVGHSLIVDRSIWLIVFVVEVRTPAQQQRGLAFPHLSPPERR